MIALRFSNSSFSFSSNCTSILTSIFWNSCSLTETERNSSVKTDVPRRHSYKQDSQTTSNSSDSSCSCFQHKEASEVSSMPSSNCCSWFHCFSCPSCTCKSSCSGCKCCC
ncbi:hypothetical protein Lalb_Chr10g0098901 [Lupinus albus]|uniref:Uncharacterized protein n=1 Tax=Lupinus albus TaxID=3870 RepID=A0A6A4PV36_LUPAL|nr:hypothetical protein Lalb_Chr10g0098901 [Lupinus albus]